MGTNKCMDKMNLHHGENIGLAVCHHMGGNQAFVFQKNQHIMSDTNACLSIENSEKTSKTAFKVNLMPCDNDDNKLKWKLNEKVCLFSCFLYDVVRRHQD